jgi:hypothetical protein
MLNNPVQILPTKKGQIVKIFNLHPTDDPDESYLLAEDPAPYDNNKRLLIYPITEILRAKHKGGIHFGDQIAKGDLTVVGESLESWVHSWNYKSN